MRLPKIPKRMTPAFGFSVLTRAVREGLSTRQFGQQEAETVVRFFGSGPPECAFCGSADVRRWDHLVPVGLGGDTVLGNIVLACGRCDDSKGQREFEEWMLSNAPFSPTTRGVPDVQQRIARLKAYMTQFGYAPRRLEERLSQQELERFATIRSKHRELRCEIDELIEAYQERRGRPPNRRLQPAAPRAIVRRRG
jgi:hypothetical protein